MSNKSMINGDYDMAKFFSYDLSELRNRAAFGRHHSLRDRFSRQLHRNNHSVPFKILKNLKKPEPMGKINVKLNKEGVEMINAVRRK